MKAFVREYCPNLPTHQSQDFEYELNSLLDLDELRTKLFKNNTNICKYCKKRTDHWIKY